MSKATICDRCKITTPVEFVKEGFILPPNWRALAVICDAGLREETFDLCPSCLAKVYKLILKTKPEEKGRD